MLGLRLDQVGIGGLRVIKQQAVTSRQSPADFLDVSVAIDKEIIV